MEKWTTKKAKEAIKQGEKELATLQIGSKEWCRLFYEIEIVKEDLR